MNTNLVGLAVSYRGFGSADLYREEEWGLAAATSVSIIAMGLKVERLVMRQPTGYEDLAAMTLELGLAATVHREILLYASAENPYEPEIAEGSSLRRRLKIGVRVETGDRLTIAGDVESTRGRGTRYSIGESIHVGDQVTLLAGFRTSPFVPSFGMEFRHVWLVLCYTYRYHPDLGGTHLWGFSFAL
jgi:hypothetical protein